MIPYGLSHLSAHHPYNQFFYATIGKHSHQASLNYSSHPSVTRGFEDMMASFTMIGSPFASMKNKKKLEQQT
jgi:hypothetical protein